MRSKGEGTLFKRTVRRADGSTYERWQAGVTLGRKPNGRPHRVYGPLRASQAEAKADLAALRAQAAAGGGAPDRQRLAEYLDAWLASKRLEVKTRTFDTYKADIENHVKPTLGSVRLGDVAPAHVKALLDELRQGKRPSVARKVRAVLHAALGDAVREERILRNPVAVTAPPATPKASITRWSEAHARAFAQAAVTHADGAIFLLILATGLRIGEALGLMWDDLEGDVLTVRRQVLTVGVPRFDLPKTERSIRRLRLGADVLRLLEGHRAALEASGRLAEGDYPLAAGGAVTGVLMFPDEQGRPYRLDRLRPRFQSMLAAARLPNGEGIPEVRIHDLRHFHLSRLISLGLDPATVSRRAGHSRTSTTMDIYVDAFEDRLGRVSVTLDDLVGGIEA